MRDDRRRFAATDPEFPTTPALTARLISEGAIARPIRPAPAAPKVDQIRPSADQIGIGDTDGTAVTVDLARLLAGRLLIQGSSGAGKSATLRRLIEQAHRHITTILVDPESEFGNLATHIGATSIRGADFTSEGLTAVALRARAHRLPIHLDLSDLEPDARILQASAFFTGLVAAPRADWGNTCLVAIDEAHLLAPHLAASARDAEARRLGVAALTDLCARGRKRGLAPVIATQRLAKLASSVLSELQNFLLGLNVLDRDVARAADLLGWSYDKASVLRDLPPGRFIAQGPALCRYPTILQIGACETVHIGSTPDLLAAAGHGPDAVARLLDLEGLRTIEGAPRRVAGEGRGLHALEQFLLDPAAPVAARLIAALGPISPNATTADELARHLGSGLEEIHAGLDLLAITKLVDTIPRGDNRIARLSPRLRTKLSGTSVVGLA